MPPVNIRKTLYDKAILAKIDLPGVVNDLLEKYLDEYEDEQ